MWLADSGPTMYTVVNIIQYHDTFVRLENAIASSLVIWACVSAKGMWTTGCRGITTS